MPSGRNFPLAFSIHTRRTGCGSVGFLLQRLLDFIQKSVYSAFAFFDHLDRNAIHSGRSLDWPSPVSMPFPACRAERFGHTTHKTETSALASLSDLASVSVERVSPASPLLARFPAPRSCHAGSSVVGLSSKRLSPPLTVARSHSAPSLHGHYPLPRYYGLSDSRKKNCGSPRFLG